MVALLFVFFLGSASGKIGNLNKYEIAKSADCVVSGQVVQSSDVTNGTRALRPSKIKLVTIKVKERKKSDSFRCTEVADFIDVFVPAGPTYGTEMDGCMPPPRVDPKATHTYFINLKSEVAIPINCMAWIDL